MSYQKLVTSPNFKCNDSDMESTILIQPKHCYKSSKTQVNSLINTVFKNDKNVFSTNPQNEDEAQEIQIVENSNHQASINSTKTGRKSRQDRRKSKEFHSRKTSLAYSNMQSDRQFNMQRISVHNFELEEQQLITSQDEGGFTLDQPHVHTF